MDTLEEKWISEQNVLAKSVIMEDQIVNPIKLVGGLDISFIKDNDKDACVTLAILSFPDLKLVHQVSKMVILTCPYINGFLGFREVDHFIDLLNNLDPKFKPDVLFIDGNGLLHIRKFGSACHLGVLSGYPTIGISKNIMYVEQLTREYIETQITKIDKKVGESFRLVGDSGFEYGACLLTTEESKHPIYVSIGHKVTLDTAIKLTIACSKYKIPEPVRQADLISRQAIRDLL